MEIVVRHAHSLPGDVLTNANAMAVNDLWCVVVIEYGEKIDVLPSRAFDFSRRGPDCAQMHAGFEPFFEEHRLHGIRGTGDDVGALTGFRTRPIRFHLLAKRGTHLACKALSVLTVRTEHTD